jgi:hypothetical protein
VIFVPTIALAAGLSAYLELSFAEPDNGIDAPLDLARARARETSPNPPSPALMTILRRGTSHPLRQLGTILFALGMDALIGGTGLVSALVTGVLTGGIATALLVSARVRRFERRARQTLLTEPWPDPLPARRYFVNSRERG